MVGMDQPVVKCLDQVIVRAPKIEPLMGLFSQKLGLPFAWQTSHNPFFSSAGIHLGNMHLSFLSFPHARQVTNPQFYGLAFELYQTDRALIELTQRGIPHTPPQPFLQPDDTGWLTTLWTVIYLGGLVTLTC